jgi:phage terminase small subunit
MPFNALHEPGQAAFDAAVATLRANGEDPERYTDAITRYANAVDHEAWIRACWELEARATLSLGQKGELKPHPLVKEVRASQAHAHMLAVDLGIIPQAKRGRPAGTSQSPDRQPQLRRAA